MDIFSIKSIESLVLALVPIFCFSTQISAQVRFVVDSTASTDYRQGDENTTRLLSLGYTHYDDGFALRSRRRNAAGALLYDSKRRTTYNRDSTSIKTVFIATPLGAYDASEGIYDTLVITEQNRPLNGGTLREITKQNTPGDGSAPGEPTYSVRYDSVSVTNDTVFSGLFDVERADNKLLRIASYEKTLVDADELTLFKDRAAYNGNDLYFRLTTRNEFESDILVRSTIDFLLAVSSVIDTQYIEEAYTYPRENYRITSRTTTATAKQNIPFTETVVENFDEFGSSVRTRVFADLDTTITPAKLVEREFVGGLDERVLTLERTHTYDERERRLVPVSLYEIFGRFVDASAPISSIGTVQRRTERCSAEIGDYEIRVQIPPGAHVALSDMMGRTIWTATALGVDPQAGKLITLAVPLPARGSGLHVLVGQGFNWQCATKVLR